MNAKGATGGASSDDESDNQHANKSDTDKKDVAKKDGVRSVPPTLSQSFTALYSSLAKSLGLGSFGRHCRKDG